MRKLKSFNQFIKENVQEVGTFEYNRMIDYTLLDNSASDEDIVELCEKAKKFNTKSVCVMPKHVKIAAECLKDSPVLVCTVVDFPGGDNSIEYKENETKQVIRDGADEVDMVLNYKEIISTDIRRSPGWVSDLSYEVKSLVHICHNNRNKDDNPVVLKVIVESGLLSRNNTIIATDICIGAGADFIKTSTGKVSVGAEYDKVKIMKKRIEKENSDLQIKVSGGVRTLEQIKEYEKLGATRFGMGYGSVDTLNGLDSKNEGY